MTAPLCAPRALELTDLIELAEAYAPDAARRVRYDPEHRWYELVDLDDDYDVWVIGWCAGQGIHLHDHGGSAGALHVLAGNLVERHRNGPDPTAEQREILTPGTSRAFAPGHVHRLANPGPLPATSVHVYSPPLTTMTFYQAANDRSLRAVTTERV